MSQSLSRVLLHLIFSTKNREPLIANTVSPHLHGYLVGILHQLECPSLQTGGVSDHVHILCVLGRTITQAKLIEEIKKSSSKWMKSHSGVAGFSWQAGYGAFSIGESQTDVLIRYIQNQEIHHKTVTFQDEFRRFLEKYKISHDERYVWD